MTRNRGSRMVSPAIAIASNLATHACTLSAPIPTEHDDGTTPGVPGVIPTFDAKWSDTMEPDAPLSTIARATRPFTLMGTKTFFSSSIGTCSAFGSQYERETPLQSMGWNR